MLFKSHCADKETEAESITVLHVSSLITSKMHGRILVNLSAWSRINNGQGGNESNRRLWFHGNSQTLKQCPQGSPWPGLTCALQSQNLPHLPPPPSQNHSYARHLHGLSWCASFQSLHACFPPQDTQRWHAHMFPTSETHGGDLTLPGAKGQKLNT